MQFLSFSRQMFSFSKNDLISYQISCGYSCISSAVSMAFLWNFYDLDDKDGRKKYSFWWLVCVA